MHSEGFRGEFGDTGCADHEQSPPHQRTHAAEHYAKLINRSGRYRRFRHAKQLTQAHTRCLEPDPRKSPALHQKTAGDCGLISRQMRRPLLPTRKVDPIEILAKSFLTIL